MQVRGTIECEDVIDSPRVARRDMKKGRRIVPQVIDLNEDSDDTE